MNKGSKVIKRGLQSVKTKMFESTRKRLHKHGRSLDTEHIKLEMMNINSPSSLNKKPNMDIRMRHIRTGTMVINYPNTDMYHSDDDSYNSSSEQSLSPSPSPSKASINTI